MNTETTSERALPGGLIPIGLIRSSFAQPTGTPIQPRYSQEARGVVQIRPEYQAGLAGLEGFERIWLLYWLDRAPAPRLTVKPRLDSHEQGIFATRAPCRPNPIALSCVRLLEVKGCELLIAEVDMVDQTPLLDIKPYIPENDAHAVRRCGWLDQPDVMRLRSADACSDAHLHQERPDE